MIYVTGDTHGELGRFAEIEEETGLSQGDKVIVCGDFGFVWHTPHDPVGMRYDEERLDALEQKPYEVLFACGNHENFDRLEQYPITTYYGAPVHQIRKNVFHLMRGYIYNIEGKSFFVFGGAYSVDRMMRAPGRSWWARELPSAEEYARGEAALAAAGYRVDYIITHTAATEIVNALRDHLPPLKQMSLKFGFTERDENGNETGDWQMLDYLQRNVFAKTEFTHWFFGHWHFDRPLPDQKATALLKNVIKLK